MNKKALRGAVFTFTGDPFIQGVENASLHIEDGLVIIEDGKIASVGTYSPEAALGLNVEHYPNGLICPGFIDAHVHYPQLEIIGAYAGDLLEWLDGFAFVAEQKFGNPDYAAQISCAFIQEALRAGTTSAAVFCTVHPESAEAFFAESMRWNTRMIAGKVLMDRDAPKALRDNPQKAADESRALLEKWHGKGRQLYAITPRFAISSTPEQLAAAGRLWAEYPDAYMHTHLNESAEEIARVGELFPGRRYLDIYAENGLLGKKAIFAHCIHMSEKDFEDCRKAGAGIVHCPTSNMFIGSGFFRAFDAKNPSRPVKTGLATDVGGGTSMSMLATMGEAYKVAQAGRTRLHPLEAWYLATRGSAEALNLEDKVGGIAPGFEADMIVLDFAPTPLLEFRMERAKDLVEKLFILMTAGDERNIRATYVAGERVYDRDAEEQFYRPD